MGVRLGGFSGDRLAGASKASRTGGVTNTATCTHNGKGRLSSMTESKITC